MNTNKQAQLIDKLVKVTVALSELHELVDNDQFTFNLFEESIKNTGALSVSLDDFIAEWQTVVNSATLDSTSLFNCWKKSAKFYRELSAEFIERACLREDEVDIKDDDVVFENGSYINTGTALHHERYILKFYVQLNRDVASFLTFDEAAEYLWKNHAKEGYGL